MTPAERERTLEVVTNHFPHFTSRNKDAAVEMVRSMGPEILSFLRGKTPEEAIEVVHRFRRNHLDAPSRPAQEAARTAPATHSVEVVKARVPPFTGEGGEPLRRWFAEVEDAISAQNIVDDRQQAYFATTCLGGRARAWAMSRRATDDSAFLTYRDLKAELKLNFEAPEMELSSRQEFMELRQGKLDLQAYAQKTQYLLSNIVYEPVPPAMQVTGFMKGLNDGPVKQSLYRHPPKTLQDAIDMSIREEFSMRSASSHAGYSRRAQQPFAFDMPQQHVNKQSGRRSSHFVSRNNHPRQSMGGGGPEPMDLSVAVASNSKQPKFKKNIRCKRCAKMGHFAHECMAPRPVPRSQRTEPSAARRHQQGHHPVGAKNENHQ